MDNQCNFLKAFLIFILIGSAGVLRQSPAKSQTAARTVGASELLRLSPTSDSARSGKANEMNKNAKTGYKLIRTHEQKEKSSWQKIKNK
ncbi:MAG: hypothetical protein ACREOW_03690 [Thermodesulfobacteriota bacterium]